MKPKKIGSEKMQNDGIQKIVENVLKEIMQQQEEEQRIDAFQVEASGRHVHLTEEDGRTLFGKAGLTPVKDLSQPGQYLAEEKVTLIGPKGVMTGVAVLGPYRSKNQVEVSRTDARTLGVGGEIRDSGDLNDVEDILIAVGGKCIEAKSSVIVAKRHIHMQPEDAKVLKVEDGVCVQVKVTGERPLIFDDVLVRVSPLYQLSMHLDYDEANAVGLTPNSIGKIV